MKWKVTSMSNEYTACITLINIHEDAAEGSVTLIQIASVLVKLSTCVDMCSFVENKIRE